MTCSMGYTVLGDKTPQVDIQAIVQSLGQTSLYGWLEDPLDHNGLALREQIAPDKITLRLDGVLVPEISVDGTTSARQQFWPQGRLFNEDVDLRWERQPGYLHLVIITEHALSRPFEGITGLTEIDNREYPLLLWGTYTEKAGWQEGRIPGLSRFYPDQWGGPYAALITRIYESEWHYADNALPTVRTVTRYLRYEDNYNLQLDPRFEED